MRSSKSRSRSKSNRNRPSMGNIINRVFDSSGPEGKVRGTPQQIIDKYNQLARDCAARRATGWRPRTSSSMLSIICACWATAQKRTWKPAAKSRSARTANVRPSATVNVLNARNVEANGGEMVAGGFRSGCRRHSRISVDVPEAGARKPGWSRHRKTRNRTNPRNRRKPRSKKPAFEADGAQDTTGSPAQRGQRRTGVSGSGGVRSPARSGATHFSTIFKVLPRLLGDAGSFD